MYGVTLHSRGVEVSILVAYTSTETIWRAKLQISPSKQKWILRIQGTLFTTLAWKEIVEKQPTRFSATSWCLTVCSQMTKLKMSLLWIIHSTVLPNLFATFYYEKCWHLRSMGPNSSMGKCSHSHVISALLCQYS